MIRYLFILGLLYISFGGKAQSSEQHSNLPPVRTSDSHPLQQKTVAVIPTKTGGNNSKPATISKPLIPLKSGGGNSSGGGSAPGSSVTGKAGTLQSAAIQNKMGQGNAGQGGVVPPKASQSKTPPVLPSSLPAAKPPQGQN